MTDLSVYPVVVVVYKMTGCPACELYVPRFMATAARYRACVPHLVLDVAEAPKNVTNAPTTLVYKHGRRARRNLVGAHPNDAIEQLFAWALKFAGGCEIE